MFSSNKKPFTAVTVQIENLTSEQYDENDFSGIVDLIEVIRIQSSGPTEAARAIRKKLKYGNVHRQLRALTILDGLIQNAGPRFQRVFADEPLLERLRFCATDHVTDAAVKDKCKGLFRQWSASYSFTPGMERIASLYQQLPQRKRATSQSHSKVLKDTEADASLDANFTASSSTTSTTASSMKRARALGLTGNTSSFSNPLRKDKDKKHSKSVGSEGRKPFNLEQEKPQLLQTLASASVASTNLMNVLKLTNRENKRVSEDPEVVKRFEECKMLRRQILRYIQHVEDEQWLGGLIHANEELVGGLMVYEVLDKSLDDDSDSEDDDEARGPSERGARKDLMGLKLDDRREVTPRPPRPRPGMSITMPGKGKGTVERRETDEEEEDGTQEEDDEDDPFADRNAVHTPQLERPGMAWKEV